MQSASNRFLRVMADYAVSLGRDVSLHNASPGSTGANEIDTERQQTIWRPSCMENGVAVCQGQECRFSVADKTVCTHWGVWAGDDFLYGGPINPPIEIDDPEGGVIILEPVYREIPT